MLKRLNYRIISALALLLALAGSLASCENEATGPAYIAVRVINSDSVAIQNAWIHLSAPGSGTLFDNPNTSGLLLQKIQPKRLDRHSLEVFARSLPRRGVH